MGSVIMNDSTIDNPKSDRRILSIVFFDLLSTMPYYDMLLINSMRRLNPVMMAATTYQKDKTYYRRNGIRNDAKIIDVITKLDFFSEKVRKPFKLAEYILNLIVLWSRFTVSRPDIVHLQWMPRIFIGGFELRFIKAVKALGIKQVYTVHNVLPHDTGRKFEKTFSEIYHLVDGIICHTRDSRQQLIDEFGISANKIRVIPFGPILHESSKVYSKEEARASLGIRDDSVAVLAFGNVKPYKGLEFLLKSWSAIVKANHDAVLMIAGNGAPGYVNSLNDIIAAEDIQNSVIPHFKFLTDDELNIYHQAADILVYPYEDITQSGAILTGMSFGKPIVASDLAGFREVIDHDRSGLLFKPGSADDFANTLSRLIQSPEDRDRLGRNVLDDIQNKFTWDNAASATLDFYHELLKSSG